MIVTKKFGNAPERNSTKWNKLSYTFESIKVQKKFQSSLLISMQMEHIEISDWEKSAKSRGKQIQKIICVNKSYYRVFFALVYEETKNRWMRWLDHARALKN